MIEVPERLRPVVEALEQTGWSAAVTDAGWRIVWSSPEIGRILGATDEELGVGRHMLETGRLGAFTVVTEDSVGDWVRLHAPFALHDGPLGREELAELVDEPFRPIVEGAEPSAPPPAWVLRMAVGSEDEVGVVALGARVLDHDGTVLGNAFVYGSALPASLMWFVGQGDRRMFQRVTDLIEPGRRPAAVLFADVEGSTDLSRRMSSAAYFDLICDLTAAVDAAILEHGGVIGKHAGDGVSAFFLAEQVGSPPGAALAALRAARAIAAHGADRDVRMNVAIHWGATLYIGRVATSGRLEVTALGDEVNECARIQEAAHGGVLLATKALVERLDPADAGREGLDPAALRYALVGELPEATEKAVRDAGKIAVADVSAA
ncbi:MAG TPA: adenylate/guanylate cyclase domain-containing protein [Solirubrobacteraceae bacterium]|nr:adenylate/guanylate cyclase domain-containing protein [Solirubrobacteraceae bacterium]